MRAIPIHKVAIVVALTAGAGCGGGDDQVRVAVPDITTPIPGPRVPTEHIPRDLLEAEAQAAIPLDQEGVRWEVSDNPNLPPIVDPCGDGTLGTLGRTGGRQLALVNAGNLFKAERLTVYRSTQLAAATLRELRTALRRCARHVENDGTRTDWQSQPLEIGDEALFVAAQRMRGDKPTSGHQRGIVMRSGPVVVTYHDFGQLAGPIATLDEVALYERNAFRMAAKLRRERWSRVK